MEGYTPEVPNENENKAEKGPERIPSIAEVQQEILGQKEIKGQTPEVIREFSDDEGLWLYEATVPSEKPNESCLFTYMRKGEHLNHNATTETEITRADYEGEMCVYAEVVRKFDEMTGEWRDA